MNAQVEAIRTLTRHARILAVREARTAYLDALAHAQAATDALSAAKDKYHAAIRSLAASQNRS